MHILYAGDSGVGVGVDIQGYNVVATASQLADTGRPLQDAFEGKRHKGYQTTLPVYLRRFSRNRRGDG